MKLLVDSGADIDFESVEKGRYAFYSACLQGHYDVAKFLISRVRDVDRKIRSGVVRVFFH